MSCTVSFLVLSVPAVLLFTVFAAVDLVFGSEVQGDAALADQGILQQLIKLFLGIFQQNSSLLLQILANGLRCLGRGAGRPPGRLAAPPLKHPAFIRVKDPRFSKHFYGIGRNFSILHKRAFSCGQIIL